MINKLFLDLDETLIWSSCDKEPNQDHFFHTSESGNGPDYYTIVNKEALDIIQTANEMFGKDNVYILTAAGRSYAERINKGANFGFDSDHIFTYSDIQKLTFPGAWTGQYTLPYNLLANKNNILVDNLPPRENEQKCAFIGIKPDRYIQVRDFYGINFPDYSYKDIIFKSICNITQE